MVQMATSISQAFAKRLCLFGLFITAIFSSRVSGLDFVAGGPCSSVCSNQNAGTLSEDTRCLDNEFDVAPALSLKECVSCQLSSTAVDPTTKITDVQWGLFNLRYTLSNCMFGYPEQPVSISSPCQVSCKPLSRAVTFGIANSTNNTDFSPDLGFCTGGQFDDTTINQCAFCYSFIPQQLILGNFLQALHFACDSAPVVGKPFVLDGTTIFNQSTVQGPTGPQSGSNGPPMITGARLILAILIPVVGGLFIMTILCCLCFHCLRSKRRAKAIDHMSKYFDGQDVIQPHPQDFSPMSPLPMTSKTTSPPQPYAMWAQPPTEMESIPAGSRMAEPKMAQYGVNEVVELPVTKSSPSYPQSRWPQDFKDGAREPLNSPDRESNGNTDDNTTVISDLKESEHSRYDSRGSPPLGTFQAQDGLVTEHVHGTIKL